MTFIDPISFARMQFDLRNFDSAWRTILWHFPEHDARAVWAAMAGTAPWPAIGWRHVLGTDMSEPYVVRAAGLGAAQLVEASKEQLLHAVCQHLDVADPGSPGRLLADLLATRPSWVPRMANGQIDWWSVAQLACHFGKLGAVGQQEMLGEIAKLPSLDVQGAKHGRPTWETDPTCKLSIEQYEKPPPATCPTKGGGWGWLVPVLAVGAVAGTIWLATRERIGPPMGGVREDAGTSEVQRDRLEREVWRRTPRDYKSVIEGRKYIMYLDPKTGGTVLEPLDTIPYDVLLRKAVRLGWY